MIKIEREEETTLNEVVKTIKKDQYEAILKADTITMLKELQTQMEEYEPKWVENDEQATASCRTWEDLDEIIQNKINALKENKKEGLENE